MKLVEKEQFGVENAADILQEASTALSNGYKEPFTTVSHMSAIIINNIMARLLADKRYQDETIEIAEVLSYMTHEYNEALQSMLSTLDEINKN